MKRFSYFLLILFFIIGIYPALVYAFLERHDEYLSVANIYKYRLINSIAWFLSLLFALWLLKYSTKKQNHFVLIGAMYGIASLMYDVIVVQITGGLLLITIMLKIYFKLFPEDRFWQKRS